MKEPYIRLSVSSTNFGVYKVVPFSLKGIEKLREVIAFVETQKEES